MCQQPGIDAESLWLEIKDLHCIWLHLKHWMLYMSSVLKISSVWPSVGLSSIVKATSESATSTREIRTTVALNVRELQYAWLVKT